MSRFLTKIILIAVVVVIAAGAVAYATTGTADDPLVSLSYLEKTFMPTVEEKLAPMVETAKQELSVNFDDKLQALSNKLTASILPNSAEGELSGEYVNIVLEPGEALTISAGGQALFLGGGASVVSGRMSDTTAGEAADADLVVNHLYIASDETILEADTNGAELLVKG